MAPAGPCRRSVLVAWVRLVTWVVTRLVTRRFNGHDISHAEPRDRAHVAVLNHLRPARIPARRS